MAWDEDGKEDPRRALPEIRGRLLARWRGGHGRDPLDSSTSGETPCASSSHSDAVVGPMEGKTPLIARSPVTTSVPSASTVQQRSEAQPASSSRSATQPPRYHALDAAAGVCASSADGPTRRQLFATPDHSQSSKVQHAGDYRWCEQYYQSPGRERDPLAPDGADSSRSTAVGFGSPDATGLISDPPSAKHPLSSLTDLASPSPQRRPPDRIVEDSPLLGDTPLLSGDALWHRLVEKSGVSPPSAVGPGMTDRLDAMRDSSGAVLEGICAVHPWRSRDDDSGPQIPRHLHSPAAVPPLPGATDQSGFRPLNTQRADLWHCVADIVHPSMMPLGAPLPVDQVPVEQKQTTTYKPEETVGAAADHALCEPETDVAAGVRPSGVAHASPVVAEARTSSDGSLCSRLAAELFPSRPTVAGAWDKPHQDDAGCTPPHQHDADCRPQSHQHSADCGPQLHQQNIGCGPQLDWSIAERCRPNQGPTACAAPCQSEHMPPLYHQDAGPVLDAASTSGSASKPPPPASAATIVPQMTHPGEVSTCPDKSVSSGQRVPRTFQCEFYVEDVDALQEFERCNGLLRRHGFGEARSRLRGDAVDSDAAAAGAHLVVDGRSLWTVCSDVLAAFEERGRRLREAVLADKAQGRNASDGRMERLVRENARLEAELQACKSTAAEDFPPKGRATGSRCAGVASVTEKERERERELAREVAETSLKLRAAEATARHREREIEKLRARLEQLVAEGDRRQARERVALARPLRRRGGAAVRGDDPAVDAALAHKARADALQTEVSSLTKQVHVLTFQLEDSEERCRRLEGQQQFLSVGAPATASPATDVTETQLQRLREEVANERNLRESADTRLAAANEAHVREVATFGQRLQDAHQRTQELEVERRASKCQPTPAELRWQREALRLRDELASSRRIWRGADPREQMRRDKEIRRLGLDERSIEESATKADLVRMLVDVCRSLKVSDVTQVESVAAQLRKLVLERLPEMEDFVKEAMELLATVPPDVVHRAARASADDQSERAPEAGVATSEDLLVRLRQLCEWAACSNVNGPTGGGGSADRRAAGSVDAVDQAWRTVAAELQLAEGGEEGSDPAVCVQRMAKLRLAAAALDSLVVQLRCDSAEELPRVVEALKQLCDERIAAQRIVDALQRLLHVNGIAEVLPALKEVLDVAALRRRTAAAAAASAAAAHGGCMGAGSPRRQLPAWSMPWRSVESMGGA